MKKTLLLLIFALNLAAQSDFNNLSWKFRGPENYTLDAKGVIDIATDPNNATKLWACTLFDGLIYNDNIKEESSEWKKSTLPIKRVYKIKFDPNRPQIAYAIGDFSTWKTTDAGKTWTEISSFQGRFYDIWVSKKGNIVAATKNIVYLSVDEGKTWKQILLLNNSRTIKQLWVQENERIYVLQNDNSGQFADASYNNWQVISLNQMRREEMPFLEYEEFHAFIVQSGEIFHGFTTDRRKILREGNYSLNGGSTYKSYSKPPDMIETVFVGDDLVFATKKGVFISKNETTLQRNKGVLQGEFRMFAIRDFAGDNYYAGLSTKGVFMMNSLESSASYNVQDYGETNNYLTIANNYPSSAYQNVFNSSNFFAVEENKLNYTGYTHLEGKKILPMTENVTLFLSNSGEMGKWTANTTGNLAEGKLEILEFGTSPMVDIYYNATLNVAYGLYKDGKFVRIKNPTISTSITKTFVQLPFKNFEEGQIEEISNDGKQILLTDKTNNIWFTTNEGSTWQKINIDGIKDLKINHLEFSNKYQRLFLATELGFFMGENILSNSPKWTNISKEIGQQPCTYIQLRSTDQISVLTRFKGIYSTTIFTQPNQIITHSPNYVNLNSPQYIFNVNEKLLASICNDSKIKVSFTSNIPENPNINYVVEVSDDNGNFPAIPFILKGSSSKSPVETEFVKPQDPRRNGFKFRVLARGAVQATGTETPEIYISNQKEYLLSTQSKVIFCDKEIIELRPIESINKQLYSWKKDEKLLTGATDAVFRASQAGVYSSFSEVNGCVLKSVFDVKLSPNLKPFFKPNVGFSYAGNTCVVDSFKLFTDFNKTYNYQWLRDELELKNSNQAEIFVKDKSIYKLIITNQEGCKSLSEPIQLKTCETTTGNQAILLNPPKILSDKTNIYTNEKSLLSIEGCPNVNLQWLKDTKPILGAIQNTLEVKESGNYALQIEKFGCVAIANSIKITVENVLALGEELAEINIKVYPNPTNEKLFVSIPVQIIEPIGAKLIDISGKLIENYDFSEIRSKTIDVKTLKEGVYLLVFEMNGKRVVKKIIKKD